MLIPQSSYLPISLKKSFQRCPATYWCNLNGTTRRPFSGIGRGGGKSRIASLWFGLGDEASSEESDGPPRARKPLKTDLKQHQAEEIDSGCMYGGFPEIIHAPKAVSEVVSDSKLCGTKNPNRPSQSSDYVGPCDPLGCFHILGATSNGESP